MSAANSGTTKTPIMKRDAGDVKSQIDDYNSFFDEGSQKGTLEARKKGYTTLINHYYDLVTDFYEYGWGESFHFANRFKGESFIESIQRHESYLALRMKLNKGDKVADIGCGVGGPLRRIAHLSEAHIYGINNNIYQIERAKKIGVPHGCGYIKTDFLNIPVKDGEFDHAYAIEATCHAPDRVACYSEVFRIIKAGGYFAGYEWVMTDKFDAKNPTHQDIKYDIQVGDALPDIVSTEVIIQALKDSGFEVLEYKDLALDTEVPWSLPLQGESGWNVKAFRSSAFGRIVTMTGVWLLETLRLAPKGALGTLKMLEKGASGLVRGEQTGIFTPMLFFIARKPL